MKAAALTHQALRARPRAVFAKRNRVNAEHLARDLLRLIAAGRLDARKIGGKTVITRESIERLIAELPRVAGRHDSDQSTLRHDG